MIEDPNFSLDVAPNWVRQSGDDPGNYTFIDDARDIVMALSARAHDIAAECLVDFVAVLAELRVDAELNAARSLGMMRTVHEPIIVPQTWGGAIAYFGHDDRGHRFSYSGMVTPHTMINLYMESAQLSENELAVAMDEVVSQIVFDRVPLAEQVRLH